MHYTPINMHMNEYQMRWWFGEGDVNSAAAAAAMTTAPTPVISIPTTLTGKVLLSGIFTILLIQLQLLTPTIVPATPTPLSSMVWKDGINHSAGASPTAVTAAPTTAFATLTSLTGNGLVMMMSTRQLLGP